MFGMPKVRHILRGPSFSFWNKILYCFSKTALKKLINNQYFVSILDWQ
jgi:hypothetical protein